MALPVERGSAQQRSDVSRRGRTHGRPTFAVPEPRATCSRGCRLEGGHAEHADWGGGATLPSVGGRRTGRTGSGRCSPRPAGRAATVGLAAREQLCGSRQIDRLSAAQWSGSEGDPRPGRRPLGCAGFLGPRSRNPGTEGNWIAGRGVCLGDEEIVATVSMVRGSAAGPPRWAVSSRSGISTPRRPVTSGWNGATTWHGSV